MKFQDSSFNCSKVTEGIKNCDGRTDGRTHTMTSQKQYAPPTFGGIKIMFCCLSLFYDTYTVFKYDLI